MKIAETQTTVTTLDLTATFARNVYGGSPLRMLAIVATTERGTYCAGNASNETIEAHRAALKRLGLETDDELQPITRGVKSVIELGPRNRSVDLTTCR